MGKSLRSSNKWTVDHALDDINSTQTQAKSGDINRQENSSQLETLDEQKARKRSHLVGFSSMLIISIGFSIVQSGVWPYLKLIKSDVTKTSLGWIVTANPVGQMIFAPLMGLWSNKLQSIRIPCLVCLVCLIGGNIMYSTLYAFEGMDNQLGYYMMMLARFTVGLSAANVTLVRSYIGSSTTMKERTTTMTMNYAAQSMGFVIGPGIQALLTVIVPTRIDSGIPGLVWDQYTSAGWVVVVLAVINIIILMPGIFKEHYIAGKEYSLTQNQSSDQPSEKPPKPNYVGAVSQCIAFGLIIMVPSVRETLGTPMIADQYGIPDDDAVYALSIVLASVGLAAIFIMMIVARITRKFDDRKTMIIFGYVPLAISMLLHYPIGNKPIVIANCTSDTIDFTTNNFMNIADGQISRNLTNFNSQELTAAGLTTSGPHKDCLGCPYETQPWCLDTPQITPPQLIATYFITRVSFSIAMSFTTSVFTKILGPTPLGLWMSLLSTTSSLIRITGPIWLSFVYEKHGTIIVYLIALGLEILAVLIVVLSYKNIAPMSIKSKKSATGYDNTVNLEDES